MKKLFSLILFCTLSLQFLFAQESLTVTGTVIGEDDGLPLIGANVIVKGTTNGVMVDFDGKFTIEAAPNSVVVISMLGYQSSENVITTDNQVLEVTLAADNYQLDDIVVIGYGTMKKSDLTGSVSSIKAEDLQKTPASGIDQALQGKVAGVTVNSNSGQPGEAAVVRIRGIGTVNNSAPIYVVDGMIVSDISFLSPNEISSTEILKDASATAIYGSRGANGVILITTKKGTSGEAKISVNSYYGIQNRWNKLDLMQRDEFAETYLRLNPKASSIAKYQQDGFNAWMKDNVGSSPYFPMLMTATNPYGMDYSSVETDWQDEVFNANAAIQDYYISISGGDNKNNYVVSASYFTQDGTVIGSNYERLTLRANTSFQVKDWLKVGQDLSFVNSTGRNAMHNSSSPGASILSAAIAMAPWDPTHYPEGSINNLGVDLSGQISAASNFKNVTNPFSMVENNHPENITERWVGDVYLELTPFKNFKWRSAVSIDLANNRNKTYGDAYVYSDYDKRANNFLSSNMQHYKTLTFENIANYALDLGQSSFNFMVGQTTEEWNYYSMGGAGASILNPFEYNWYLSNTTENKTESSDDVGRARMFSLLSRVHYSLKDRYLLTLNLRADATSKFLETPWGYFPSAAFAWRVSEENWFSGLTFIDMLKFRLGWGRIGNEKVNSDSFLTKITETNNVFVGYPFGLNQTMATGAAVLSFADISGKWETTEQLNTGIDFGFYNGLISGSVEGFIRTTKDMILAVTAPAQVGNRYNPVSNVATVVNKGIELSLSHFKKIGEFDYTVSGNVSFINNELTGLNGGSTQYSDRGIIDQGLALYSFWGYQYEGLYYTDQEALDHLYSYDANEIGVHAGDAKYTDLSGPEGVPDGKIDDYDKTDLGNPFPWLTYGMNIQANYKNFDLQLFFQGVYGNKIYNALRYRTEGAGNEATLSTSMRDVWIDYTDVMKTSMEDNGVDWTQLVNPNGTIPNPTGSSMNKADSDRFIEDGSYFRLKNIQLGYSLSRSITEKVGISRCRIYLSASNLFTITKYTGYDPEVGSGVDYGNYPQARTFIIGVNLDL